MSLKTYTGSCHCGAIRFEAELDLAAGSNRCNCSWCFKGRSWFAVAEGPERFRLRSGADDASLDELAASPLRFVDGRNDRFDQPLADTRAL